MKMKILITTFFVSVGLMVSAQLQNALISIQTEEEVLGMSVVTLCGGEVDQVHHLGLKDVTRDLPVDNNTMFRIASVSKLVTAMALMKLYDQGLFGLDDDVSTALGWNLRNPNYPNTPITYRMLLSHTSSLQDGDGYGDFLEVTFQSLPFPPNISDLLIPLGVFYSTNMFRVEQPGTFFTYSNINYGVIGTLIEKWSNQRFDTYIKQNILTPMGITGSYNVTDLSDINDLAVIYRYVNGWVPQVDNFQGVAPTPLDFSSYSPGINGLVFGPQGGLRISALDLAKVMKVHLNNGLYEGNQILSSSAIQLMHAPEWSYNGANGDNFYGLFREWGLGLQRTTNAPFGDIVFPEVYMMGHAGEAYGLISDFYFDPISGSGIILAINGIRGGYEYGESSAFYKVEEKIFDAAHDHSYLICTANVKENKEQYTLQVYPNPATDLIYLRSTSLVSPKIIKVHDASGRLVYEQAMNSGAIMSVDVSSWAGGFYQVEAFYNNVIFHGWFEVIP